MPQRKIVITGGNAGIGRATAQVLLEKGHHVILLGRSAVKLQAAVATLKHRTCSEAIDAIVCDLSSFSSIRLAASNIRSRYTSIDVLINNAGGFSNSYQLTNDGFEWQFAVNYLGPFLLTKLLLPLLEESTMPRIVNVASVVHFKGSIDFDSFCGPSEGNSYNGLTAYAQSKLAMVLFTRELAQRHPHIKSNCLHPGTVRSRIGNKNSSWYYSLGWSLFKPFMQSTRCGAQTPVYLAISPEVNDVSGRYFDENQCCRKPSHKARNPELARELWDLTDAMVMDENSCC